MKVKCIDDSSPRSDGIFGGPTGITLGETYEVAEILETQYSIINDQKKMTRHSKYRFEVVDWKMVKPLRDNFNTLTTPLRLKIRELEKEVARLNKEISSR